MRDFSQKYLKYKTKYLNSKNVVSMNMRVGSLVNGKVQFVDSLTPITEAGIEIHVTVDLNFNWTFVSFCPFNNFCNRH